MLIWTESNCFIYSCVPNYLKKQQLKTNIILCFLGSGIWACDSCLGEYFCLRVSWSWSHLMARLGLEDLLPTSLMQLLGGGFSWSTRGPLCGLAHDLVAVSFWVSAPTESGRVKTKHQCLKTSFWKWSPINSAVSSWSYRKLWSSVGGDHTVCGYQKVDRSGPSWGLAAADGCVKLCPLLWGGSQSEEWLVCSRIPVGFLPTLSWKILAR